MQLVREMRKDTEKLRAHILALEMFLLSVNPAIQEALQKELNEKLDLTDLLYQVEC
jgi:hypothetical protein